jgi:hypothetical protein
MEKQRKEETNRNPSPPVGVAAPPRTAHAYRSLRSPHARTSRVRIFSWSPIIGVRSLLFGFTAGLWFQSCIGVEQIP